MSAKGSQEAEFTQPMADLLADLSTYVPWKQGQRRMGCGGMGEKKPLVSICLKREHESFRTFELLFHSIYLRDTASLPVP